jgi:hypothetical protein
MGEGVGKVVPDMAHGKPMRIRLLAAGRAKMIVCCEQGCTVQAVSWMHVTPKELKLLIIYY